MEAEGSDADYDDLSEVDTVWLGSEEVSGEEFVAALDAVENMQHTVRNLKDELRRLDIGLDRTDAVNLLWGRTTLNKGEIESTFEVLDAIVEEDADDIAPRLLADKTSELSIAEAATVWDEIVTLAEKYGTDTNDTEDTK